MSFKIQDYRNLLKSFSSGEEQPPIIFLGGEESYYMDRLTEALAEHYLPREEWMLNRSILYGSDLPLTELKSLIFTHSLLGGRRLYIVREANALKGLYEVIDGAKEIPQETTVVLCYNGDPERNAPSLMKQMAEAKIPTYLFPKLRTPRDAKVLIHEIAKSFHIVMEDQASDLLYERIGGNGTTLYSEIRKLALIASAQGGKITTSMVARDVGISREFSPYELLDAVVKKQRNKAYQLARHMGANEKKYPLPMLLAPLYNYFSNLLIVQYRPNISPDVIAHILGLRNRYAADIYTTGMWNYSAMQVFNIVHEIRMVDARFKGCEGGNYESEGLLSDLITFILG
ncbi:MAG: hypothetical protein PUI84_07805 [Bacteroidales bacterium]|nr:hypothetical protein [Porphyromonas sp.]MDD6935204.1 hypothetical protein [Bacteroidales bacterium]MDY3102433.1 hypothetical protein [Porphyromonas sp.]